MNELQAKAFGCIMLIVAALSLLFGSVFLVNSTISHITDYKIVQVQTDGAVSIARLQAQSAITVGCEENSWFTTMKQCIEYGGVNGVAGVSWWTIAVIVAISAVIAYAWMNRQENYD